MFCWNEQIWFNELQIGISKYFLNWRSTNLISKQNILIRFEYHFIRYHTGQYYFIRIRYGKYISKILPHIILNPWLSIWKASYIEKGEKGLIPNHLFTSPCCIRSTIVYAFERRSFANNIHKRKRVRLCLRVVVRLVACSSRCDILRMSYF